ncbi:hypothetical protein SAMN05216323_105524 [Williamwhitmania taraxaci]|uniref:Uncharacterized protein n=2 Tax=Williamwhitmania taraxaci TaxID=1640674 RepID=A0A1G6PVU8_9BACT|nr:hypothetical protein SAMN05216323_105524 [Williamwhitmania taraxaci]
MLISVLASSVFTFFLFQLIYNFNNCSRQNINKLRTSIIFLFVIIWIFMIFLFWMHFSVSESSEIRNNGVKVAGTILEGKSIKGGRGRAYSVVVQFKTAENVVITVNESVDEDEFLKFKTGQKIELIYSLNDPKIIELLTNKSAIKNYYGSEERDLTISDLFKLLDLNDSASLTMLKKIAYEWKFNSDSTFYLKGKTTAISIDESDKLIFYSMGSEYWDFPEELETLGFKKTHDSDNMKTYESPMIIVNVQLIIKELQAYTTTEIYTTKLN